MACDKIKKGLEILWDGLFNLWQAIKQELEEKLTISNKELTNQIKIIHLLPGS
jgi:hypothetical protein